MAGGGIRPPPVAAASPRRRCSSLANNGTGSGREGGTRGEAPAPRGSLTFSVEARPRLLVPHQLRLEGLDGHPLPQLDVGGLVHGPHPPCPDQPDETVLTEDGARRKRILVHGLGSLGKHPSPSQGQGQVAASKAPGEDRPPT
jgi:hypothetical protein